jgi:hypothetical protein
MNVRPLFSIGKLCLWYDRGPHVARLAFQVDEGRAYGQEFEPRQLAWELLRMAAALELVAGTT